MSGGAAVEAHGLVKSFGGRPAVAGASFEVRRGSVAALLGRNGAGKTTALKLVLGFLRADAGASVLRAERVGYVPEEPSFFPWLTGAALLGAAFVAARLPADAAGPAARGWMERLDFDPSLLDRPVRTYSHGNRKKFSYLQSLVLEPDLLIVDEPLAALDPGGIRAVREIVLGLRRSGRTVLLSSHIIAEMDKVADGVILMHRGRVLASDSAEACRSRAPEGEGEALERWFLAATG